MTPDTEPRGRGRTGGRGLAALAVVFLAAATAAAAETAPAGGTAATAGAQATDLDAPPDTRHRIAPGLSFGAKAKIDYQREIDYDLDRGADDERATLEPELRSALSFDPVPWFRAFLEIGLMRRMFLDTPKASEHDQTLLTFEKAYVSLREPVEGATFTVGRQRIKDRREWLLDENLDAVRATWESGPLTLDGWAGRFRLLDEDVLNKDRRERVNNYLARARYDFGDWNAGGYVLYRDDFSDDPEDLLLFGVQSDGEPLDGLEYWAEVAGVAGSKRNNDILGFGFDVGATFAPGWTLDPSLTVGFAFGSGDADPKDGGDRDFRQSGLQDNNGKFNGVTRFKYYGEVFDPELSNMEILTVGAGIRPTRRSSIDLVYHHYWQVRKTKRLRDVAIDLKPKGPGRDLGHGIDLVIGFREIADVDIELVMGAFLPGDAFADDADNAYFVGFEAQYKY